MTLEKLIKGPRSSKIPPRLPNWGRPTRRAAAVALASALTVVGCKGHTDPASKAQQERTAIDREPTRADPVPLPGARDPSSMADVVEKVLPSVVSISMTKASQSAFSEPLLRRFFGRALPEQRGLGSGVIVSKDGVILTNNHVVDDAREITVLTSDKRQLEAQLVGTDPKSDLAVLRVKGDASSLKPIPIGDSSRMRPGDIVLAVGNPFGVGQAVTMGIVSAVGRANLHMADYEDFIQTDAAINPGNSGGALINLQGELVGINTLILSRTGGYQGVGFAIPTNMAKPIMESLLHNGKVVRGWLGVAIQDIEPDMATALKLPSRNGVLISDVNLGSPAEKAGLRRGDVVLKVDNKPVDSAAQLRNLVAAAGAGSKTRLMIQRDGSSKDVDVVLGESQGSKSQERRLGGSPGPSQSDVGGLSLEELTPAMRQRLGIASQVRSGVVVVDVAQGSTADKAGLEPGDVLIELDGRPIQSVDDFRSRWNGKQGKRLLLVYSRGNTVYRVVSS